jgi:four helix bundle protein
MANIAEGQERGSVADFVRFLRIAKASCAELRSHLFLAGDIGYADAESIRSLQSDANEVARIIGGLIQSMKRKQIQSQACSREPATLTNEATG